MSQTHAGPDGAATYRTPQWVKVFGGIALVLVLLVAVQLLSGVQHGPGMHMPSGGNTPFASVTQDQAPQHGAQHP